MNHARLSAAVTVPPLASTANHERRHRSAAPCAASALFALASCLWLNLALAADPQIIDVPLPNGDFSQGLAGWTVEISPTGATPPGSVQVVNGSAVITKGGAFQAGLNQSFDAPDGLQALRLRLTQLPQFAASGSFIPEAFDVHVTGPGGFTVAAAWRPGASAAANAGAVPAGFNLGDGATFDNGEVRIPLPAISAGTQLNIAATLVGASVDTSANVAFTDVVMEVLEKTEPPEPPEPDRLDGCGIFRDRFEVTHGVGFIARCAIGQINDTGITTCTGGDCPVPGLPGQDAEFGRDALAQSGQLSKLGNGEAGFDFTKLDIDGEPLPASASEWACVRDNYTGLVWEAKQNNASAVGHFAHTFSWFESNGGINGGNAGQVNGGNCQGSDCDTQAFVAAFNEARVCGVSDWRLPSRQELASIVPAGRSQPSLDPAFFPLGAGWYWTATPVSANPASAWRVNFDDGSIRTEEKTNAGRIRLVREVR